MGQLPPEAWDVIESRYYAGEKKAVLARDFGIARSSIQDHFRSRSKQAYPAPPSDYIPPISPTPEPIYSIKENTMTQYLFFNIGASDD